jgi:short-subunit dehydrogenase
MNDFKNKTVWIVGASSGIGQALAFELDKRGASLILSARREPVLHALNQKMGDRHRIIALDVSDHAAFQNAMHSIKALDSAVFMAAAYNPGLMENMNMNDAHTMMNVNVNGALHFIHCVYPFFILQKYGQIALCGSVAGYCGLPHSQPYSATKAAIISLAESLRTEAERHGIDVKLISPGFVETPLTDKNDFEMPMIMKAEDAAIALANGLLGNNFEIHFPKKFTFIVKLLSWMPYSLFFPITRSILAKKLKKYLNP